MEPETPLTELCPKCGLRMFNWPGRLTKCIKCLHEWYMDTNKQASDHSAGAEPK